MPKRTYVPVAELTPEQRRGRRNRNVGKTWEREIANRLKALYPEARRGIGQSRSSGEVADITGLPWWVEAKKGKKPNLRAAHAQADRAQLGNKQIQPVIVVAQDACSQPGKPCDEWVMLRWDVFYMLVDSLEHYKRTLELAHVDPEAQQE